MLQGIVNCWKTHDCIAKRSFGCVFIGFIEILYYLVFVPCLALSVNGGFQVGPISIPGDSRQISKYDSWESHFNRGFLYGAHYQLPVSTNKALAHNMEKTMKSHWIKLTSWGIPSGNSRFFHISHLEEDGPAEALWFQTGEPRKQRHPLKPGCFTRFFGKNIGSTSGKIRQFLRIPH